MLGTTYNRQGDEISGAAAPESTVTRTILRERAGRGRWGRRSRRGSDLVDDVTPFLPDEPDDSAAPDEPGATAAAPSDQVPAAGTDPDTTKHHTTAPDRATPDKTTLDTATPATQDQPGARGAPPAAKTQSSQPTNEVPFVTMHPPPPW